MPRYNILKRLTTVSRTYRYLTESLNIEFMQSPCYLYCIVRKFFLTNAENSLKTYHQTKYNDPELNRIVMASTSVVRAIAM